MKKEYFQDLEREIEFEEWFDEVPLPSWIREGIWVLYDISETSQMKRDITNVDFDGRWNYIQKTKSKNSTEWFGRDIKTQINTPDLHSINPEWLEKKIQSYDNRSLPLACRRREIIWNDTLQKYEEWNGRYKPSILFEADGRSERILTEFGRKDCWILNQIGQIYDNSLAGKDYDPGPTNTHLVYYIDKITGLRLLLKIETEYLDVPERNREHMGDRRKLSKWIAVDTNIPGLEQI